jgi:hypothetical protein
MNRRIVAAALGGIAAVASVGTALALPAHPSNHSGVLKFTANTVAHRNFKTHYINGDKDLNGGHLIGIDTLQCIVTNNGKTANCDVAAAFRRGLIYGTFSQNLKNGALSGKVTGGTRFFKDAAGTITGKPVNDNQEAVTVTYQAP